MKETTQNEPQPRAFKKLLSKWLQNKVNLVSDGFNKLSQRSKRVLVLIFGITAGGYSLGLIVRPFLFPVDELGKPDRMTQPTNINKEDSMKRQTELIPIGKMKGEINGEFESFYVALDHEGEIYINRNPSYGDGRFVKDNGWDVISNEQFRAFEKELHFIPHSRKGLTP